MNDLLLTYAGLLYLDRTLPLLTGDVRPRGVDLRYEVFPRVEDLFRRQAQTAEFPVSEMSLGTFMVLASRGDSPFVGLPVFPSRHFRHRELYVHAGAGITDPATLRGKRIGVPQYQMTAAVWVRALLQHDFGLPPQELTWCTGGLRVPVFEERLPIDLPPEIDLRHIPAGKTLEGMLETGELDALVTTERPPSMAVEGTSVRRLFPDFGTVEREYFERTGVFPIMHLVVIRRDVYRDNPWLASSLTEAFGAAKSVGNERLRFQPSLPVGLPWLQESIEEVDRVFGGDAFPYGVEPNRPTLQAIVEYAHEQGLVERRLEVSELFAPEVLDGSW